MSSLVYIAILAPALGFVINGLLLRFLPERFFGGKNSKLAGLVTISSILVSFIISLFVLVSSINSGVSVTEGFTLLEIGPLSIKFGLLVDQITSLMLVLVSGVSLLVQIYAVGYMKHDANKTRFFAYMSLFTASMLGVVSASNLVVLFVFWEMVGVCSYLLIGHWYNKPEAAKAAKKAFVMTRIGDFGFLVALIGLGSINYEWLDVNLLYAAIDGNLISTVTLSWLGIGFLFSAIGKSAQLPLHSWLADAMEGPTPVSALLHSATMVTLGVFLIARLFPLFASSNISILIAIIGLATGFVGATMALVNVDIKRILAFSTISQIGYMFFALGIGAYSTAIFYLFVHAFFKAGLFMVAGAVGHEAKTYNVLKMGGLRSKMPKTYIVALVSALSLAPLVPLSGFFAKDEIFTHAFEGGYIVLGVLGYIVSLLTAFYIVRLVLLTFHGSYRGEHSKLGIKDVGILMVVPMFILTAGAVVLGFLLNPPWFDLGFIKSHWLAKFLTTSNQNLFIQAEDALEAGGGTSFNLSIALVSIAITLVGMSVAYFAYRGGRTSFSLLDFPAANRVKVILQQRYYIDFLYDKLVADKGVYGFVSSKAVSLDNRLFDTLNIFLAKYSVMLGRIFVNFQTGRLQTYGSAILLGMGIAAIIFYGLVAS